MNNLTNIQYLNFPELLDVETLEKSIQKTSVNTSLSLCYLEDDSQQNRVILRKLLNNNNEHVVVVSKNKELSFLAWKANTFGFILLEDKTIDNSITERLKKYPPTNTKIDEKLRINFKGGFDLVNISTICFCVGSGNYTEIFLDDGTKKCISYPLSNLEKRLQEVGFLSRIGKSFIVNINKIKKVQTDYILFKGSTEIKLNLGNIYIKRVKKNLLWY